MIEQNLYSEHWSIAWRMEGERAFHLIENPPWAWAADPFLVDWNGEIYLFAELFLFKSERNGVIGYCKWDGRRFDEWQVSMDKHWHLSYPNVFVANGKLYMVPESYQREDVSVYVMERFPDVWKHEKTLIDNVKYVDTTFLEIDEKEYMFTFAPTFQGNDGVLMLYEKSEALDFETAWIKRQDITEDVSMARPGGNFFREEGKLIRVGQDSTGGYGVGLAFMEVEQIEPFYKETLYKRIFPHDIMIDNLPNDMKISGMHTYNRCACLEVIDLKYSIYLPEEQEARARVRKVFVEKYK